MIEDIAVINDIVVGSCFCFQDESLIFRLIMI